MSDSPPPRTSRVRKVTGEVDAKEVSTRSVIPSSQVEFWAPFVRVGETASNPRKRFAPHPHQQQEVLIYFVEGLALHTTASGRSEELRPGSVLFLSTRAPTSHAINPRPGRTARWFSIVSALPAETAGSQELSLAVPAASSLQPDGTTVTPLLGPGTSFRSALGVEAAALHFREDGTAFPRIGPHHRSLFYALGGRGTVDNVPLQVGEAALIERAAAVSLSGAAGFVVVQATAPAEG